MNLPGAVIGKLFILILCIGLVLPEQADAQDLEPRRWSHLPIGMNIVGVGYIHTEANIFFSPVLQITDGTSRINSLALNAIHTFELAGKSTRISALVPYTNGEWDGDLQADLNRLTEKDLAIRDFVCRWICMGHRL
jgi:hypothetical protein